ncbi:MAG TPA: 5-formyltetrahydrofolate cyclo-ligase [Candidatus Binatia bacterium]|jgi:5-formyltetrahydrofolate cyclo-ligase|nr:5-formyltetrahydrofolate cyclo-ligase [Candidatus Binatia bacterium]
MHTGLQDSKAALRRQVREQLNAMTPAQRSGDSAQARTLLLQQLIWHQAKSVLFFAPLPQELDLWPLLEEALAAGKSVGLPRFASEANRYMACQVKDPARDLHLGQFGIREPVQSCLPLPFMLDLILVPGVAFDLHGRRLGRGKGHYDQLLTAMRGTTCGVAFDEQIVRAVPVEPHDVHLNCLLTPTRWLEL